VIRACPSRGSSPTSPSARPRKRLVIPFATESPNTVVTAANATTISAKYSAGPNPRASVTRTGAANARPSVASVPATKLPSAAVANAAPPRPAFAMQCPSIAVTIVALSPGVLSRIDVVEPPYIAP
jgi:hypothetical protein